MDTKWDLLLKIVGDFEILIEGRPLLFETEFCLVEFALQLARWIESIGRGTSADFEYVSMESEAPALVWFRRRADGWELGALEPEGREHRVVDLDDLLLASKNFLRDLRSQVELKLQVDLKKLSSEFPR